MARDMLSKIEKSRCVDYVLRVLADSDALQCALQSRIVYGSTAEPTPEGAVLKFVDSGFFGREHGNARSLPVMPLDQIEGVPLLFGTPEIERQGKVLVIHADIIASTYFLLTRYEEWVRPDMRDSHGRFPGRESLPYRAGFVNRPVVDQYAELLYKWAREMGVEIPHRKRRFSVLLTHDVDYISTPCRLTETAKTFVRGVMGRQSWGATFRTAAATLGLGPDPSDNLGELIHLDSRLTSGRTLAQCRVVYFFMAGGQGRHDGKYDVCSRHARHWIESVKAAGGQIGLHASYESGKGPQRVAQEREILEEVAGIPITMNRHHFLGWREPEHGHDLSAAGITSDSTMGYAEVAGFRLGTCRPVPLFCPVRLELLGIEEHPLIVMDGTLSGREYMSLDVDEAFACVRELVETTYHHGGEFVALWHNTALGCADPTYPYHRQLYMRVLDHLGEVLDRDCVSEKSE